MLSPSHFLLLFLVLATLVVLFISLRRQISRHRVSAALLEADLEHAQQRVAELDAERERDQHWASLLINRTTDLVLAHEVRPDGTPGRFVEANDAACQTLGYPRERLLSMNIFDIEQAESSALLVGYARLHDTDSTIKELAALTDGRPLEGDNMATMRRLMKRVLLDGQAAFELMLLTADGQPLPVEVQARRFSRDGTMLALLSMADVTQRQATEQALVDSVRLSRDFFAQSAVGAVMYDGERALANVNRIALRLFGVPDQQEFSRHNLFDSPFTPPDVRELMGRGESVRFEMVIDFQDVRHRGLFLSTRSDRAHFHVMMSNLGLDKHYEPKGYLFQIQDMTQQRAAEADLKERDRQLRQAQKLQAIGTLAGGIAHDFNNILTPVLGYSELAYDLSEGNETLREYLREVIRASSRAKELATQILTFSRQVEPETKPIRLSPIVKEVLNLQKAILPKTIRLTRVIKAERDVVVADPSQLHQVLMNLCTNAVHAMRDAGGELEVTLVEVQVSARPRGQQAGPSPGRYLKISVRDTGTGIPPAVADRIFEPFFTTKERGEGTGMGLAVVHGIISSLKGSITFETKAGKGTTFHVQLPAAETDGEMPMDIDEPVHGGHECILVVDDEVDILQMQSRMLASLGYRPVVSHRSPDALRLYEKTPTRYDVVITDQVMPDMSGLDLARHIHRIRPEQPILICSGFSDSLPPDQMEACGVRDVLQKPVSKRHLAQAIRRALEPLDE